MRGETVIDSTVLIGLERIDQLYLIPALLGSVYIPPAVQADFGTTFDWLNVVAPKDEALVSSLELVVDRGEAAAIALARERKFYLVVDDRRARQVAGHLGIPMVGTVGLLVLAKRRGLLGRLKPVLLELEGAGFHLGARLLEQALKMVDE